MTRFRAAGIHLLLSAIIIISLLALMFGVWYPNQYFKLMGGDGLVYLIAGIDICLGPLLTLAVFKPGKKHLKFDLIVIALLQIAALAYGGNTMLNARPVFTAYAKGYFSVATALEVTDTELGRATKPEWRTRSLTGPVLVAAKPVTDNRDPESMQLLTALGMGYARFPRFFVAYESQQSEILKAASPLSLLRTLDINNNTAIDKFLKKQARPEQDFVFVSIASAFAEKAAILDAKTAAWVTIIDATPTPPVKQ